MAGRRRSAASTSEPPVAEAPAAFRRRLFLRVDLARKNLLHDKLRFLITVSGVAFAVTLVFVQVGLFLGLLDNASVTIEHLDADLWVTSRNTPNVDFAHTFPESYLDRVRSVPGVAAADNLIVWFMTVA